MKEQPIGGGRVPSPQRRRLCRPSHAEAAALPTADAEPELARATMNPEPELSTATRNDDEHDLRRSEARCRPGGPPGARRGLRHARGDARPSRGRARSEERTSET